MEYLGRVVFNSGGFLYPDSVVGTDSHTTMIDGLGVAGWGVGGIEAEAAMLGQVSLSPLFTSSVYRWSMLSCVHIYICLKFDLPLIWYFKNLSANEHGVTRRGWI